jgi:hypothetical protein
MGLDLVGPVADARLLMLETVLLLLFCAFMGLLSLAIVVWLIITGSILAMDSLLLSLISLTAGGIFMAVFAWSVHTGEFRQALSHLREKSSSPDASAGPPAQKA